MPVQYKVVNVMIDIMNLPTAENASHLEIYTSAPVSFQSQISTYLSSGWVLAGGICVSYLSNNTLCFSQSLTLTT